MDTVYLYIKILTILLLLVMSVSVYRHYKYNEYYTPSILYTNGRSSYGERSYLDNRSSFYDMKFLNYKIDLKGNLIGMTCENPNLTDSKRQCINSPCPDKFSGPNSVCWYCIDVDRVADDFKKTPDFTDPIL